MKRDSLFNILSLAISGNTYFTKDVDCFLVNEPDSIWHTKENGTDNVNVLIHSGVLLEIHGQIVRNTIFNRFKEGKEILFNLSGKEVRGKFVGYTISCANILKDGKTAKAVSVQAALEYNSEIYTINIKDL